MPLVRALGRRPADRWVDRWTGDTQGCTREVTSTGKAITGEPHGARHDNLSALWNRGLSRPEPASFRRVLLSGVRPARGAPRGGGALDVDGHLAAAGRG